MKMKQMTKEQIAAYEGFRLHYQLFADRNRYTLQCVVYDERGRMTSQYSSELHSMNAEQSETFFRLVADNCVFPVHIREILNDCLEEWKWSA